MAPSEMDRSQDPGGALLLHADHVVTLDPAGTLLADGAVLVGADGRIAAVGPAGDLLAAHSGVPVKRLRNRVLLPGLVNLHCHSGLLRGTAEGLPVWDWLKQFIDPMHRVIRPDEAELASRLCYAEALLSGTTTIVDMWRHMAGSARAAADLGLRAVLVPYVAEHPDHDYFETLDGNEALIEQWHGGADGRIQVWVGLEHMFYAVPEAWKRAVDIARRHRVGLHTHSNESRFDVAETQRRYGMAPVQALEAFGLLDAPRVLLAHAVWLDEAEMAILARRGVAVAHNPVSNMKLASGAAPVKALLDRGVAVGIGTDGEKENNNLDMLEEMKVAALLANLRELDAAALAAGAVVRMATLQGARALGMDQEIGSLEPGKSADLIAVRTDTPRMTPLLPGPDGNLLANLVFAAQGGDVDLTMVAGRILVEDGRLRTGDLDDLIRQANRAVPELFRRRAEWLASHGVVHGLESTTTEPPEA